MPIHIYFEDLATNKQINMSNDVLPSASTRKISILVSSLRYFKFNGIDLNKVVPIPFKYMNVTSPWKSGKLQHTNIKEMSLKNLLKYMMVFSDNTATATIVDIVGLDFINEDGIKLGLKNTIHRYGMPVVTGNDTAKLTLTTVEDLALLIKMIVTFDPKLELSNHDSLFMVSIMKLATPTKLTKDITGMSIHKGGTGESSIIDAACFYDDDTPRIILICFITEIDPSTYAYYKMCMASLGLNIFNNLIST